MLTKTLTQPSVEPISVEQARTYLYLDSDLADINDDDLIANLIKAAREYCERYTQVYFSKQTVQVQLANFTQIYLPGRNINEIVQVQYIDRDGITQTLTEDHYFLTPNGQFILSPTKIAWPEVYRTDSSVLIDYTVGLDNTPQDVVQAYRLLISHFYENRQENVIGASTNQIQLGVASLLARHRVLGV